VLPTGLHSKLAFDRLVFFSDAVFAIAITLLALELRLPEGIVAGDDALWRAILGLWPRYLSFLVSFLVIGLFWIGHHRMFRLINRFDDALLWINLLFLMCIVVIPYPTSVLGEHPGTRPAVILYAGILATTGLLQTGIWLYATTGRRLVDTTLPDAQYRLLVHLVTARVFGSPMVFLVSMAIAYRWPTAAMYCWILIAPNMLVIRWLARRAPGA
jgi:uncharacterized membrane protein